MAKYKFTDRDEDHSDELGKTVEGQERRLYWVNTYLDIYPIDGLMDLWTTQERCRTSSTARQQQLFLN